MSTVNQRIRGAVLPHVSVCVHGTYKPGATEAAAEIYCEFNYSESPELFGDDAPGAMRYLCQVHLYAPASVDTVQLRKDLRRAIHAAGFTYPNVEDASDEDGQHFVCELEDTDGEV